MKQKKASSSPLLLAALTGGIATGKSIAAGVLSDLGCFVAQADEAARAILAPGLPAWEAVVAHFGQGILNQDRSIDRKRLGAIIFADEGERRFMNALIHPLVLADREKEIARIRDAGTHKIYISEAALTIEAGYQGFFDKIIITHCLPAIQIQRLMDRDGIRREDALKIIKSQMPQEDKLSYADYSINTSGNLRETVEQTERIFRLLMQDYELKAASSADEEPY